MNSLSRTIVNPLMGEKVTFLKTAEETNGEYALVEVDLAPLGGVGLHYHTHYAEYFEVIDGVLGIECDGKTVFLHPGESITAHIGSKHRFFNDSETKRVTFRTTITPARQFEQGLRIIYGLICDGKTNKKGIPNIWHLALMFEKAESYFPGLPLGLQVRIFRLLANIARRKGKDKDLLKYYVAQA